MFYSGIVQPYDGLKRAHFIAAVFLLNVDANENALYGLVYILQGVNLYSNSDSST